MTIDTQAMVQRFLRYTTLNTTAIPDQTQLPSNPNQLELAKWVAEELKPLGCVDISVTEQAILTATYPANAPQLPTICLFAHLDTAPDTQSNTQARIETNYQGGDIALTGNGGVLSPNQYPELNTYIGDDIIVTDGTSLLGADDKAAIAEILEALCCLKREPNRLHGDIKVVLVPDEEIGLLGAKALDVPSLNADLGICLDCCGIGEYVVENWYAGSALFSFTGVTAHPMSAKGKLKNALLMAQDVMNLLPATERPEHTEGKEGYFWVKVIEGDTARATMQIAIREFDAKHYQERKELLQRITDQITSDYGIGSVSLSLCDEYSNVATALAQKPQLLQMIEDAMAALDIQPHPLIMRGGYDGSAITPNGLTTLNIFTGAHNFHSIHEFLPVKSMQAATQLLLEIIERSRELRQAGQL